MQKPQEKTGVKAIRQQEIALKALELRKAGATYEMIAQQLGYKNKGTAFGAVARLMNQSKREGAKEAFEMELRRLDDLLMSVWPAARQGEMPAIDRALRIMERRAKMLGIDAPERSQQQIQQIIRVTYEDVQFQPTEFEPDVELPQLEDGNIVDADYIEDGEYDESHLDDGSMMESEENDSSEEAEYGNENV